MTPELNVLRKKIPALNVDLAEACTHAYNGESARMKLEAELARRDEIITRLKDAGNELYLKGCRNYLPLGDADWAWRALMKELE